MGSSTDGVGARLQDQRDRRLVDVSRVLLVFAVTLAAVLGVLLAFGLVVAPSSDASDSALVLGPLVSLAVGLVVYLAALGLSGRGHVAVARNVVFTYWLGHSLLPLALDLGGGPGRLVVSTSTLFVAMTVSLLGYAMLERWARARWWLAASVALFVTSSVVRVVQDASHPDVLLLAIGLGTLGLALVVTMAFFRVTLVSLERMVEAAEEAREREHALREAVEVARDAALEAGLARSRFFASMTHELRSPLAGVAGYLEMIVEDGGTVEEVISDARRALGGLQHVRHLVDELLDLSRLERADLPLRVAPVDLRALVDDLIVTSMPLAHRFDNELHVVDVGLEQLDPGWATDELRLRQVLLNLLANACKYTEAGRVTLEIEARPDQTVVFRIEDTGTGIPEDQLDHIFRPFGQVRGGTRRAVQGTGLGLAVCRSLCERLGARLSVESTVGVGSIFTVEVPRQAAQQAA